MVFERAIVPDLPLADPGRALINPDESYEAQVNPCDSWERCWC